MNTAQLQVTRPSEDLLYKIENYEGPDYSKLMEQIAPFFTSNGECYPLAGTHTWRVATHGRAELEDILNSLMNNYSFWRDCWASHHPGGLHYFNVSE